MAARIELREVTLGDLEVFFRNEQDPEAIRMAAFTSKDPADRTAFDARWEKIRADHSVRVRTILVDGDVVGSVLCHTAFGEPELSYWIRRDCWGKGVASEAVRRFLEIEKRRPLLGRAVADNAGSIRVLEKCGFTKLRMEKGFAYGRGEEVEEVVMLLPERKPRILFLCTGNSCRSQMAEGWARHLKPDQIEVESAGVEAHGMNPHAIAVMKEAGVDITGQTSKLWNDLPDKNFDYVVTVCGHADEVCPVLPATTRKVHHGFDDPPRLAKHARTPEEALAHYRRVRDEIRTFVEGLPGSLTASAR